MIVSPSETAQSTSDRPSFTRTSLGVITQYEIFSNFKAYLVELWRGRVKSCTCRKHQCPHGELALLLEDQYQEAHAPKDMGSCMFCGHLARVVRGVAICGWCAS